MGICKRRLLPPYYCFLLLPVILYYFLFSSNYTKLESPVPNTLKLILEDISVPLARTNDPRFCSGQVLILQLITSHAGNYKLRQRTRKEFNSSELAKLNIRRMFLIGQTTHPGSSPSGISNGGKFSIPSKEEIWEENEKSADLVVGNFGEAYRNLTYKHLMGLAWARDHCSQAQFVLKQDDDIFVDLYGLVDRLQNGPLGQALQFHPGGIYGKILSNRRVERNRASKWFVTDMEFGSENYPDYVSGWAYVTTPATITKLLFQVDENVNFFWIDDVLVTGILRNLAGIDLIEGSDAFAVTKDFFDCCRTVSNRNGHYWCDFIFGPSPGDATRFHLVSHSRECYLSGQCRRRTLKESLLKTCVITRDARMHSPKLSPNQKGKPLWELIKLAPST